LKSKLDIAVAGCINRDTVRRPGMREIKGLGGTLYNIFGLSRLLDGQAAIIPVCNVGIDVFDDVIRLMGGLNNVRTDLIRRTPFTNNRCVMTYSGDSERSEIFTGFVPAISFEHVRCVVDADLVLINFISGRDLTLRTLQRFRRVFGGVIYLDFHTLSLGLHRNGTRFMRRPVRWREYVACSDYLQLNASEFELLAGEDFSRRSAIVFYERSLMPNCRVMLVTLGEHGAAMIRREGSRTVVRFAEPTLAYDVRDTTGAGDLFAAGFCAGLSMKRSLAKCLKLAVRAGSEGCAAIHPQDVRPCPIV
jgi:sugar/nucleoside kinase (ribokinase family)